MQWQMTFGVMTVKLMIHSLIWVTQAFKVDQVQALNIDYAYQTKITRFSFN